ncbi:MAG: hypothetical protein AVDCRST_MAG66-60, partial [uncultured Pseudonocardia sp.]
AVAPRVLLLDEPFTGLDATTRADLLADLGPLLRGTTTVLVTHDRAEAAALADRVALLVAGRVRQEGPAAHVLDHPADVDCAHLLGFTNVLPRALTGRAATAVARPERTRLGSGTGPGVAVPVEVRRVVPLGAATRLDLVTAHGPLSAVTTDEPPPGTGPGAVLTAHVAEGDLRAVAG